MDEIADLIRRLESLIRYGTIAEVQMAPPRVRVQSGKLNTAWRPWVSLRAGDTSEWDPPTVGEQCVFFSPSGEPSTGFALVGLFSDAHPAPSTSPDEHVRVYPDGARISYNHASGTLSATGIKSGLVQASSNVTVDCPSTICTGDVLVMGNLTVNGDTVLGGMATIMKLLTYLAGMAGKGGAGGGKTLIETDIEHVGAFSHRGGQFTSTDILQDGHRHAVNGNSTGGPQ